MAELQISNYTLGTIAFNYEELKAEIEQKAKTYETLVYSEENMREAKADKAKLNSLKKALNDERIRRQKMWMEPFDDFKAKVDELIRIIDKPANIIDKQVKEYEEAQKAEKKQALTEWVHANLSLPEWLEFDRIFDNKWLNVTCSMKTAQGEIESKMAAIKSDIDTICELPYYSFEAMEEYKRTLDLRTAMQEGKRLADIQIKKQGEAITKDLIRGATRAQEAEDKEKPAEMPKSAESSAQDVKPKTWKVSFECILTAAQAHALKAWFENNNIEYTAKAE